MRGSPVEQQSAVFAKRPLKRPLRAHSSKDLLQQLAGVFGIESGALFYDPEATFWFETSQSGFPEAADVVLVSPNHPKAALLLMIGEGDTAANL